jgi:hypothetical protein
MNEELLLQQEEDFDLGKYLLELEKEGEDEYNYDDGGDYE